MGYVAIGVGAVVAVGLLFRLLTVLSKHLNRRTPLEVAEIIERHLEGTEGPWDWDDFTSVPMRDGRLDAVRARCLQLDQVAPERRNRELRRLVENLRSQVA